MIKLKKNKIAYVQIGNHLLIRISNGELDKGSKIGTIRNLANDYNVTTKTIQKAIDYLEDKGAISRIQSSGIFIEVSASEAKMMLRDEAEKLTKEYIEELREINNIDIIGELIKGGLQND